MRVGFTEKRYVIVFPPKPKFSEAPILFWHSALDGEDSFAVNTVVNFQMTYPSAQDAQNDLSSAYMDDSSMYNRPYVAAVTLAVQGEVISDALGVPVKEKPPRRRRRPSSYSPW